jgi:hypothetical protein
MLSDREGPIVSSIEMDEGKWQRRCRWRVPEMKGT